MVSNKVTDKLKLIFLKYINTAFNNIEDIQDSLTAEEATKETVEEANKYIN